MTFHMKILDLFAGIGGTAKGIQEEVKRVEYVAVDNDQEVCEIHKLNNPGSTVFCEDVNVFLKDINKYDFIWASPPCQTHSRWNLTKELLPPPDLFLYELILYLKWNKCNFVVENVTPYYGFLIKPTIKIDRHCFWSSFYIEPFKVENLPKRFDFMTINDWRNYHGLEGCKSSQLKERQSLRNAVHSSISAGIIRQYIQPYQELLF